MAEPDLTANYALKLRSPETVHWLVPKLDPDLGFGRWLETRLRSRPRQRGRLCDTAAELVSRSGTQPPWVLLLEVEARAQRRIVGRLLEYLGRALNEFRTGADDRDPLPVVIELIYLQGRRRNLQVQMVLPGTTRGLALEVRVHCLAHKSAAKTLRRIAQGKLGKSILCWVPLMNGGDQPEIARRWGEIVRAEPDQDLMQECCDIALIWAEWLKRDTIWRPIVEGLSVWKSKYIESWREEGRVQGRAKGLEEGRVAGREEGRLEAIRLLLLQALRTRFSPELPSDLEQQLQNQTDLEQLTAWFEQALLVSSLEEFRQRLRPTGANGAAQRPQE